MIKNLLSRNMKFNVLVAVLLITPQFLLAQSKDDPIHLWQAEVPGAIDEKHPPVQTPDTSRGVIRITDITDPLLEVFLPDPDINTGTSVIIMPGGGYQYLAVNIEGYEIAEWLNGFGITAFVLHYRVPDQRKAALWDLQQAIRLVKENRNKWNIDKVGVLGFSAGGNLAAKATPKDFSKDSSSSQIWDMTAVGPDFSMLIYPAFLAEGPNSTLSSDINVNSKTPPTFIFSTEDDPYSYQSARTYVKALDEVGITYEFHELPEGGHGYGIRPGNIAAETWPNLAEKWLKEKILRK